MNLIYALMTTAAIVLAVWIAWRVHTKGRKKTKRLSDTTIHVDAVASWRVPDDYMKRAERFEALVEASDLPAHAKIMTRVVQGGRVTYKEGHIQKMWANFRASRLGARHPIYADIEIPAGTESGRFGPVEYKKARPVYHMPNRGQNDEKS